MINLKSETLKHSSRRERFKKAVATLFQQMTTHSGETVTSLKIQSGVCSNKKQKGGGGIQPISRVLVPPRSRPSHECTPTVLLGVGGIGHLTLLQAKQAQRRPVPCPALKVKSMTLNLAWKQTGKP